MLSRDRFSIFIRILLPLLALPLLGVAQRPHQFVRDLQDAREASQAQQHRLAAARLLDAYRLEPWRSYLLEPAGLHQVSAGLETAGISTLETARSLGALSPQSLLALGDLYLKRGEDQKALAAWQDSLELGGPSTAYERIYQRYRAEGAFDLAAQALSDWTAAEPGSARARFLLGEHLALLDPGQALPWLLTSAEIDSSYSRPVQALRKGLALAANSEHPGYGWVMIGRAFASLGEWELAQAAFQKGVDAAPDYAEAWAFLGEARSVLKRGGKAELDRAQALAPDSILVHALQAIYWRRNGNPDLAIKDLEAMVRQEPGEPAWLVELGSTWVEKGDLITARLYFEKAVSVAPESPFAWKALSRFSSVNNMDIQNVGLPAARKAVLLDERDAEALDLMGLAFLQLEDMASAERFLQRSLQVDPQFAAAYLHLGQVYLQQGDPARAHPYLVSASELGKDDPVGIVARRLLRRYYQDGG